MKTKSLKKKLIKFVLSILIIPIIFLLIIGIPEREPNSILLSLSSIIILIGIPIFIISIIFLAYVEKVIIKPLYDLAESVKRVSKGSFDTYIENNRDDEIGILVESFNQMIDSLKSYREKESAEKEEKKELIASITHDLSTPLSVIQSYIDGISDGIADSQAKQSEYISIINDKIRQLDERIKALKNYNVYSEKSNNIIESIDAREMLDKIVNELIRSFKHSLDIIHYRNSLAEGIKLNLSYRELEIIIENLLTNSIKYNDKQSLVVEIDVKNITDKVILEFKDNGSGIAAEDINKIFIPLYKVDKSRTSDKSSMGLGLSIVKNIVENIGGDIKVKSTLNEFTVFTIKLPISKWTDRDN